MAKKAKKTPAKKKAVAKSPVKSVAGKAGKKAKTPAKPQPVAAAKAPAAKGLSGKLEKKAAPKLPPAVAPILKGKPPLKANPAPVPPPPEPAPVVELKKIKSPYSAKELREFRELMIRIRQRLTGQIDFLATDHLSRKPGDTEVDYRSEEQGTDNFERDFALNRVSSDQDAIFEIDEALGRVAMKSFGVCDMCGHAIEKPRLKALPYSRMCVKCKSEAEAGKKKFRPFEESPLFPAPEKPAAEGGGDEE